MFRLKSFTEEAIWTGIGYDENCTNPEALFESIVAKPTDLISFIKYSFFDKNVSDVSTAKIPSEVWSYTDNRKYGRCYTARPTTKQINYGIKKISLRFWTSVIVYFHTPGKNWLNMPMHYN